MKTWTALRIGVGLALITAAATFGSLSSPAAFARAAHADRSSGGSAGQIVFTRSAVREELGLDYVVNPDGTNEHLLFDQPAFGARWSPDGQQLTVARSDDFSTTIVDAATGGHRDLAIPDPDFMCGPQTTDEQCEETYFDCAPWSPDGHRLACGAGSGVNPSRNGLYTVRASDGQDPQLVALCPPACDATPGDWSPSGNRLVFTGTDADGAVHLYAIGLDGRHLGMLTPDAVSPNDGIARWAPHGNQILFAALPAPGHRFALWTVRSDGSDMHQLPVPDCGGARDDPDSVGCPQGDWSPDGRSVVYSHVTLDGWNNWVANLRTGDAYQLSPADLTGVDNYPDWGPASR